MEIKFFTMKKRILTLLIGVLTGCSLLLAGVREYSYTSGSYSNFGFSKKQTYDVAMAITDRNMLGKKIVSIKACSATYEGIGQSSLWISNRLLLSGDNNRPDLLSVNVAPVAAEVDGIEVGLLATELEEPIEITSLPLYIGYTIEVTDIRTEQMKKPVLISESRNSNGFWLHTNSTVKEWTNYEPTVHGVAVISLELEGDYPTLSLGINNLDEVFAEDGKPFTVDALLTNTGTEPISSIEYSYSTPQLNGNAIFELSTPIQPNLANSVTVPLECNAIEGTGSTEIEVVIEKVNGIENPSACKSGKGILNVVPYIPRRRVLLEEYTGTWCQYCTRGSLAMELINDFYGDDVVLMSYHVNDPMVVDLVPVSPISLFPSATINRGALIDPYYGSDLSFSKDFYIKEDLDEVLSKKTIADVRIVDASIENGILTLTSETMFVKDIPDAFFKVDGVTYPRFRTGYSLTVNGLHGEGPQWAQMNAYAGLQGYEGTYLEPITELPSVIDGMIYNDVVVCTTQALIGASENIPRDIKAGELIYDTYQFKIGGNPLIPDFNNIVINTFIVDWLNDGDIINANKYSMRGSASLDSIESTDKVVSVEYYDLNGIKVNNPQKGIFIKVERTENGNVRTQKVRV